MPKTCLICSLPINLGAKYFRIESGEITTGAKSGLPMLDPYNEDVIHFECMPDYMASSAGEIYDSIHDRVLEEAKQELREERVEEIRSEIYDAVVDELGKTCHVCGEEMEEYKQAEGIEEEEEPPQHFPLPGQLPFIR